MRKREKIVNTSYCRLTYLKHDNPIFLVMMKQKFFHLSEGDIVRNGSTRLMKSKLCTTLVLDGVERSGSSKENNETKKECRIEENNTSDQYIQQRLVHIVYQRQPKPDPEKAKKKWLSQAQSDFAAMNSLLYDSLITSKLTINFSKTSSTGYNY